METKEQSTFISDVINGLSSITDIDDYITWWHDDNERVHDGMELYQYLGMTEEEYEIWLQYPETLQSIVDEHKLANQIEDNPDNATILLTNMIGILNKGLGYSLENNTGVVIELSDGLFNPWGNTTTNKVVVYNLNGKIGIDTFKEDMQSGVFVSVGEK